MSNDHDQHFKALMAERSFFEPFLKIYLPRELVNQIEWATVRFHKMGGKHQEDKTKKIFESDVVYLAELQGRDSFLWIHAEHQAKADKMMPLRILNYQMAELLAYSKQNPKKLLPTIITFIYHQGEKPWPYSINIADFFTDPVLAMRYLGHPILIDLPATPDEILKTHPIIAPIELILKHIRQKHFEKMLPLDLPLLREINDKTRSFMLKYLIRVADVSEEFLFEQVTQHLLKDREVFMTVEEQILQRGMNTATCAVAKNMLQNGVSVEVVQKSTGLSLEVIAQLQKETK